MSSRIPRLLIALIFALVAAGVTLVAASAQDGAPPAPAAQQSGTSRDCTVCHTEYQMSWQNGAHGQAGSDPVFLEEWTKQGKPGACLVCHTTGYDPATATFQENGVTCQACHGVPPADHPKSPMPVDRSPDLCGRCHSDTRFGWQDWKVSTHYQRGMNCTTCHDPHSASLKKLPGQLGEKPTADEVSALCINCHKEHSMEFPYTAHNQKGVSCVDCHVNHIENTDRAAHSVPDHSFNASLDSCNTCHAEQMHSSSTEAVSGTSAPLPVSQVQGEELAAGAAATTEKPEPVSPIGFAALAALLGLAGGMVLAPWLERWYQKAVKHNREDDNG
jgi:predicted CXXCH cytochrome family protein